MAESAKLSALVVARNEAAQLGACLDALRFADEIVVLLDRSTDDSAAVARGAGAKVVEGAWDLEGPRRNAGYEACAGSWILEVDADERVTPALATEIAATLAAPKADYYLVPMANHIGSRLVRYGWGAYNGVAAKPVLFRKGAKRVLGGRVHPKIELHGKSRTLENPMLHFVDRDFSDMFARLNRYTDLAALDARDAGRTPNVAQAFRRFWSRGWKSYVARRGYREGAYGMALALFSALYPLLIELKLATLGEKA
ncbi:MAG: glycosyltransferase family 2 protein [Alphaproteobacteria bacterium]|nr:glycosyltransferase family 2 protein [Alphaproteobacteria bacterium]